jgi:RNA 2',3'-cyclic 3'-phosphodiesterase
VNAPGGAPRLRLFVALDLPAAAIAALVRFRDAAADPVMWRSLDEATFHVTLAFLGHRPQTDVAVVGDVLASLAPREPPALGLGAGLLLPPRRARVLTVALADDSGALGALQAEASEGLAAAGVFTPEARRFRPHVTVARIRPGARARRTVDVEPEPVAFEAGPVVLYRSHVRRGGATYEPLVTRTL